jgi:hypothetical protein
MFICGSYQSFISTNLKDHWIVMSQLHTDIYCGSTLSLCDALYTLSRSSRRFHSSWFTLIKLHSGDNLLLKNFKCDESLIYVYFIGARCWWRSWLRHCATSREVAGSITDGVTGTFHWHIPTGRTITQRSAKPLTEKGIRNISWW